MKKALMIITDGFEDIEALGTRDILIRGGVKVTIASANGEIRVKSSAGLMIEANELLAPLPSYDEYDIVLIPGGEHYKSLSENDDVLNLLKHFNSNNKLIASICAGPVVLEKAGILKGRTGTSFPNVKSSLSYEKYVETITCQDGNLTTSRGPGSSLYFGLAILESMGLTKEAADVKENMLIGTVERAIAENSL